MDESEKARQYFLDLSEAESWLREQKVQAELNDELKDEATIQSLLTKHATFENEIDNFHDTVTRLGDIAEQLTAACHPSSNDIILRRAELDKLHIALKALALEKRTKLERALQRFALYQEMVELRRWIFEKGGSTECDELGQDYQEAIMIRAKYLDFIRETESIGGERVSKVNFDADKHINADHGDSAIVREIGELKDEVNKCWAGLLDLFTNTAGLMDEFVEVMKKGEAPSPEREKRLKAEALSKYLNSPEGLKPLEGFLTRKHEWKSSTKKATNRSWNKVYLLVKDHTLYAYKDQKSCKQEPDKYYRGEPALSLIGSTINTAFDYRKRCHVFRLKLDDGGVYLLWARDQEEMENWILHIHCALVEKKAGPGSSQTLPLS